MSMVMDEDIKRWTVRRKSEAVLEILQRKTTVAEGRRKFDLEPSEVEERIEHAFAGMENALQAQARGRT